MAAEFLNLLLDLLTCQLLRLVNQQTDDFGFVDIRQGAALVVNNAYHQNAFSYWLAKLVVPFVVGNGLISEEDGHRWLASLDQAQADDSYFFSSVPIVTTATRTG